MEDKIKILSLDSAISKNEIVQKEEIMEDMYSFDKGYLEKCVKEMGNMIEFLIDDLDIVESDNELDIVIQFTYKTALLRFIQKICNWYDWLNRDMPSIFASIETDDLIALFREVIDMAEDVIKEKEKEHGI